MIEFRNVSKSYGDEKVLENLNLRLREEHAYILTGESGIGKTTLIRLLLGLEHPDEGSVVRTEEDRKDEVSPGVVFQEDRLCEEFSAVENLKMIGRNLSEAKIREELSKLLPEDVLDKPVKELSGGQKRRVAIVRAMAAPCTFYALDEPFTGLDDEARAKAIRYIRNRQRKRMLIITAHRKDGLEFGEEINLDEVPADEE